MPVDINQTILDASLDNLNDIIVPHAVGYFPPAPAWYIVGLLVLAFLFHLLFQFYISYKKNLYKREALKEIEHLTQQNREEVIALLSLAKRVAIVAYGRGTIAKLSSSAWWDFMQTHSKVKVSRELRVSIEKILYDKSFECSGSDFNDIKSFVKLWIKTHKVIANV
jgi:hypothetical protein